MRRSPRPEAILALFFLGTVRRHLLGKLVWPGPIEKAGREKFREYGGDSEHIALFASESIRSCAEKRSRIVRCGYEAIEACIDVVATSGRYIVVQMILPG